MASPTAAPSFAQLPLAADMRTFAIMTLGLVAPIAAQSSAQTVACSGTVALVLGSSPLTISDGPNDYSPRMNCTWTITSPPGTRIMLTFSLLDTESWHDIVFVENGQSRSRFSGATLPPPTVSTGPAMRVAFSSDDATQMKGFVAALSLQTGPFTPSPSPTVAPTIFPTALPTPRMCSGVRRVELAPNQVFALTDGPANYAPSMSCTWNFTSTAGTRLMLSFSSFQTHQSDFLLVYDGARLRSRFSGTTFPSPIVSTGPVLTVVFTSDLFGEAAGFLADVRA